MHTSTFQGYKASRFPVAPSQIASQHKVAGVTLGLVVRIVPGPQTVRLQRFKDDYRFQSREEVEVHALELAGDGMGNRKMEE
jgi:hypothetical protein